MRWLISLANTRIASANFLKLSPETALAPVNISEAPFNTETVTISLMYWYFSQFY